MLKEIACVESMLFNIGVKNLVERRWCFGLTTRTATPTAVTSGRVLKLHLLSSARDPPWLKTEGSSPPPPKPSLWWDFQGLSRVIRRPRRVDSMQNPAVEWFATLCMFQQLGLPPTSSALIVGPPPADVRSLNQLSHPGSRRTRPSATGAGARVEWLADTSWVMNVKCQKQSDLIFISFRALVLTKNVILVGEDWEHSPFALRMARKEKKRYRESTLAVVVWDRLPYRGMHCRQSVRNTRFWLDSKANYWWTFRSSCMCVFRTRAINKNPRLPPAPMSQHLNVQRDIRDGYEQQIIIGHPARLPPRRSAFNPQPGHSEFSHVGIVPDDAVGRRVLSGIYRFPHPLIQALLHTHLNNPHRLSRIMDSARGFDEFVEDARMFWRDLLVPRPSATRHGVGEDFRWRPKTLYIMPQPSGRQSLTEAVWPNVRERSEVWTKTGDCGTTTGEVFVAFLGSPRQMRWPESNWQPAAYVPRHASKPVTGLRPSRTTVENLSVDSHVLSGSDLGVRTVIHAPRFSSPKEFPALDVIRELWPSVNRIQPDEVSRLTLGATKEQLRKHHFICLSPSKIYGSDSTGHTNVRSSHTWQFSSDVAARDNTQPQEYHRCCSSALQAAAPRQDDLVSSADRSSGALNAPRRS
ncbi:hypothetical protein PR048_028081 [Dryococelus australis]|uniref:Uncharacterized protein n=1 Tax=Dryococelus australis TaxID=614101 RepID=A0ABQ9GIB4_9NEOP|nr:hypothetical protein PR048_028081 [Dryococelus australis]